MKSMAGSVRHCWMGQGKQVMSKQGSGQAQGSSTTMKLDLQRLSQAEAVKDKDVT